VNPRASLDDLEMKKFLTLPGLELRPLGRPARSQSPYRLRYPDSSYSVVRVDYFLLSLRARNGTKIDNTGCIQFGYYGSSSCDSLCPRNTANRGYDHLSIPS
jgi:hypothetical protein